MSDAASAPQMKSIRPVLTTAIVAAMFLSACMPVVRNQFPTITGSVVDGPSIVAHADVLLVRHPSRDCSDAVRAVKADERGGFVLPGKSGIEIAQLGGETESDWALCVRSEGRTYFGIWYFAHASPDSMQVQCDLSRKVKEPEHGVCTIEH